MVILDTDHVSLLEWSGSPLSQKLETRLRQATSDEICTTVISYEEQLRGWMSKLAKVGRGCFKTSPKRKRGQPSLTLRAGKQGFETASRLKGQIETYKRLKNQLGNYCKLIVLAFDERAAVEFARLRKEKLRLGTMDLKIAAIALSQNAILLSHNRRDFGQIAGLRLEDWTT